MKKIVFCILLFIPLFTFSQNLCGTIQTESDLIWLRNFQANYSGGSSRVGLQYVPVTIHIVGTTAGTGYINASQAIDDICALNEQYAEVGFYFYIQGDINYIDNSTYYSHSFEEGYDMMVDYNVPNTVNMFFVNDPAGNCGYFSPAADGIAIANSCGADGNSTIAHEAGHFFSLPHTFYGWEYGIPSSSDQERVSGVNCNSAADGFCDTPPDYEADRWFCSSPPHFTDLDGTEFSPDGSLIMSYSDDACAVRFSDEQMDAMNGNLEGPRDNLLAHPDVTPVDVDSSNLISPAEGAVHMFPNKTQFSWSKVPNATGYLLQISYTVTFSGIKTDVYVSDTAYLAQDLAPEKKYYWRVKALGEANSCEGYSASRSFETGAEYAAALQEINTVFGSVSIYPNPVLSGEVLTIEVAAKETTDGTISLRDLTGKLIMIQTFTASATLQTISMQLPALAEGMYFIQLSDGTNALIQKVMISK